ncbi:Regulator of G-protein signaling loco [Eumeta japonica]|uniref:Regulator of G-protein signaling loco n=1 Tax=Eumeta variegata TaxID=151549 RepID=A0A4C1TDR8_EUMVA|nr:Regulator of G-protein signaling loco [Eumeta japonica]
MAVRVVARVADELEPLRFSYRHGACATNKSGRYERLHRKTVYSVSERALAVSVAAPATSRPVLAPAPGRSTRELLLSDIAIGLNDVEVERETSAVISCVRLQKWVKWRATAAARGVAPALVRHLAHVHKINITKCGTQEESESEASTSPGDSAPKKSRPVYENMQQLKLNFKTPPIHSLGEILAMLAAKDGFTINGITQSEFIRDSLSAKGYKLPMCVNDVMNLILKYYEDKKKEMIKELSDICSSGNRLSVSIDEWTSIVYIPGKCGAVEVRQIVEERLKHFGVKFESDVVAVTSDGPKSEVTAARNALHNDDEHSSSDETSGTDTGGGSCISDEEPRPQIIDDKNNAGERASPFRRWTTSAAAGGERDAASCAVAAEGDGARGGRVARWSLGLEQLLADEAGAGAFAAFLAKEFAVENIRFWNACERYAAAVADERVRAAAALWERHLADGAPEPVNVDAAARRAADPQRAPRPPPPDLFRSAQNQIFNLMKFDSYPRFLRSSLHAECARADLRGLPLPHAPASAPALPAASQDQAKLKKSASNASERRRSGGSLLPWARLRAASRDRDREHDDARAPSPASGSGPATVGCSLCRVVLPDGATSVVGVEAGVSVRALVDRLLARRALSAAAYDVLVMGDADAVPVDVDTPSTVLGGRQATVERRCVFRLELGGRRAVGVRCRPGKRLRHVLRPVLAKYSPAAAVEPLVLRDGRPVSLDTRVQEVDGARLQLAGLGEQPALAAAPSRTPEHDDEREPLSVRAALRPAPAPHAAPPLPPKPRLAGPAPAAS